MNRGLNFGFIGLGQCGGNIANEYSKLGYEAVAINTSSTDLEGLTKIDKTKRLLITDKDGVEGAGKNPNVGEQILTEQIDSVMTFIQTVFNSSYSKLFVCLGLGGGSGCGMVEVLSQVLSEIGFEVSVIGTLPNDVEAGRVKLVALSTYEKISNLSCVTNIFLVDNEKISKRIPGISLKSKYEFANSNIAKQLNSINEYSQKPSTIASFDAKDLETVLSAQGLCIINEIVIDDIERLKEDSYLTLLFSRAMELSISPDLDFDNLECLGAVFLFDLPENTGKNIKEKALKLLQQKVGDPFDMFYGIYESNKRKKGTLTVLLTGINVNNAKRIHEMSEAFDEKSEEYRKKFERTNDFNYANKKSDMMNQFSFDRKKTENKSKTVASGKSILERLKEKNNKSDK